MRARAVQKRCPEHSAEAVASDLRLGEVVSQAFHEEAEAVTVGPGALRASRRVAAVLGPRGLPLLLLPALPAKAWAREIVR